MLQMMQPVSWASYITPVPPIVKLITHPGIQQATQKIETYAEERNRRLPCGKQYLATYKESRQKGKEMPRK